MRGYLLRPFIGGSRLRRTRHFRATRSFPRSGEVCSRSRQVAGRGSATPLAPHAWRDFGSRPLTVAGGHVDDNRSGLALIGDLEMVRVRP